MKILLTLLPSLFLSACFTIGKDFPSRTDWIKKDQTSQKDVQILLGQPESVGNSGGTPTWIYSYYKYQVGQSALYKELKLYWDEKNAVNYYSFSSSFPEDVKLMMNLSAPKDPSYKQK